MVYVSLIYYGGGSIEYFVIIVMQKLNTLSLEEGSEAVMSNPEASRL